MFEFKVYSPVRPQILELLCHESITEEQPEDNQRLTQWPGGDLNITEASGFGLTDSGMYTYCSLLLLSLSQTRDLYDDSHGKLSSCPLPVKEAWITLNCTFSLMLSHCKSFLTLPPTGMGRYVTHLKLRLCVYIDTYCICEILTCRNVYYCKREEMGWS